MMMPEGLAGIPGFGPLPTDDDEASAAEYERLPAAAAARVKQDWQSERVWREDRQTEAKFAAAKRREDVDKLIANKAENVDAGAAAQKGRAAHPVCAKALR